MTSLGYVRVAYFPKAMVALTLEKVATTAGLAVAVDIGSGGGISWNKNSSIVEFGRCVF